MIRLLGALFLAVLAVGAFTPAVNLLNGWMAGVERLEVAEAVIVMGRGGADTDGVLTNRSLRRTLHGVALARRGLAPLLVLSGSAEEVRGRGELARGLGLEARRVVEAPGARTTREEAALLARLLQPRGIQRVLLVADPLDMPRTRATMARAGFIVFPAPTASSGPSIPEARLGLLRDLAIELGAWGVHRLAGTL